MEPVESQEIPPEPSMTRQPYEVFLVLDIEGTCDQGTDFNYPNEIIVCVVQFPACYEINIVHLVVGVSSMLNALEEQNGRRFL